MGTSWQGRRVVVLGAARQGQALARYLTRHGARVCLSDVRSEAELQTARQALADLPIEWALGGHPLTLLDGADLLCLSGGVPTTLPIVQQALRRGIPLSNDTQIFLEAVPCRTVGITGSAGKTTTTSLVGEMARRTAQENATFRRVYVGGNIGDPLLNYVDEMTPEDLAILEISSFQLEQMTLSPNVAAILNITPNHLDRHGTMEAYIAAKARILEFQSQRDVAVLGREEPNAWGLRRRVRGRLVSFGFAPLEDDEEGTYYQEGLLYLYERQVDIPLLRREQIALRGDHNVLNVLAAFAIGHAAGLSLDAMLEAAEAFRGVPHRLELVREWRGARWYNDSIATAPERTMAAIRSFDEPLVLLLGGRDKDLPWEDLARLVRQRVDHLILFGEAAEKIERALHAVEGERPYTIERYARLFDAVQAAARLVEPGDVVLLSPGGTSFDEFRDFEERGERFRQWVQQLS
ncbi:MAG: UDP-N-acetylmuramoyl-L-alanine--D-glutamate ligase [Anaerolineales bacterium]